MSVRDDLFCSMFEEVIKDKTAFNYSQEVITKESKLSVCSVAPYTKTQVNFLNGNQIFGDVNDCRISGSGRYLWADESVYEGEFNEPNSIQGKGVFKYRIRVESSKYCGYFVDGKYHGKGQLKTPLFIYNGNFENNQFHGQGAINFGIESFDGRFEFDKKSHGKRVYTNGIFMGDYYDDGTRKCGKYLLDNSDIYSGSFEKGMFAGFGEYTWSCGAKYSGFWHQDRRNGLGMIKVDGSICVTIFQNNIKHGPAIVWARNGKVYASTKMFHRDEFLQSSEIEVSKKNSGILRRLMDPTEYANGNFGENIFQRIVESLVEDSKVGAMPFYPFHVNWFEIKVNNDVIWRFIRDFPDTNAETEFTSISQAIQQHVNVFQELYGRYADFSSQAAGKKGTEMKRFGLWQLLRDLELFKKSATFNSLVILEGAEDEFNILCINPDDPFEAVSIATMMQYLMYVTLHVNKNHDYVLSCAVNQRSKIFGLFATMFIIFLRDFLCPMMTTKAFSGAIPRLMQDDRTFFSNFINITTLKEQKLSIRDVFKTVELWKCGQIGFEGLAGKK